jgi:hypothetical protein
MGSRAEILAGIRSHQWDGQAAPSLDQDWIRYPDPQRLFAETISATC